MTKPLSLEEWQEKLIRLEAAKRAGDWELWERIAVEGEKESKKDKINGL